MLCKIGLCSYDDGVSCLMCGGWRCWEDIPLMDVVWCVMGHVWSILWITAGSS
jgi:hypothetical protein